MSATGAALGTNGDAGFGGVRAHGGARMPELNGGGPFDLAATTVLVVRAPEQRPDHHVATSAFGLTNLQRVGIRPQSGGSGR